MTIAIAKKVDVKRIAETYCRTSRVGRVADRCEVKAWPEFHRAVAAEYDSLPVRRFLDMLTIDAYGQLLVEIEVQFMYLRRAGIRFESFDGPDPYENRPANMIDDVVNHGHLFVYSGGADHPFFDAEENWKFRAVHDIFGHAMHGYSFGPNGEEQAYRCHLDMFSDRAGLALTTETRGQNSWVNFGPHSDLPRSERPYAQQKMVILSPESRKVY